MRRIRRRAPRRRTAGYTLIEVMMALGVLTAGAMGLMAMTQASTRGNMEAREMTVATQLTQRWMERLRRDAMNWTTASRTLNPILLANTTYLSTVQNPGTAALWTVPAPPVAGLESANFDYYGRDTDTLTDMRYCSNIRLEWLYVGRAMRADVRIWWLRRVSGTLPADPGRAALGQCAPGTDPNALTANLGVRMVYASTVIRWTPVVTGP